MSTVVDDAWKQLEGYLAGGACPEAGALGGPANDADLDALEEVYGELPAGYVASARRHDGFAGTVLGFTFPSARGSLELFQRLSEDDAWDECWLPIATNEAGSYLVVDYNTHAVLDYDRDEGETLICDTVEELLSWLAYVVKRDRPRPDGEGDFVDAEGNPWEPNPSEDPDPALRKVARWRALAEGDDPSAARAFEETFVTPDGPAFNRVHAPGEPTRNDWDRLLQWGVRAADLTTQIDAAHGAVQAGRFFPTRESSEADLAANPEHPVYRYLRGLVHFFDAEFEPAEAILSEVLAEHDSVGARSVRGLVRAELGRPAEAIADLEQALARGSWLGGQSVAREKLAELQASA